MPDGGSFKAEPIHAPAAPLDTINVATDDGGRAVGAIPIMKPRDDADAVMDAGVTSNGALPGAAIHTPPSSPQPPGRMRSGGGSAHGDSSTESEDDLRAALTPRHAAQHHGVGPAAASSATHMNAAVEAKVRVGDATGDRGDDAGSDSGTDEEPTGAAGAMAPASARHSSRGRGRRMRGQGRRVRRGHTVRVQHYVWLCHCFPSAHFTPVVALLCCRYCACGMRPSSFTYVILYHVVQEVAARRVMRRLPDSELYVCPQCDATFERAGQVGAHVRIYHPKEGMEVRKVRSPGGAPKCPFRR